MRIFVSYSSRNRPQVKALVQDLENTGHDVWYDQEAAGGHEWWADILDNIRACELFIFALTPESLDSEACRREYRYAHALHKRILPVRLNATVNPASLTVELQKINFVDYFSGAEQEYRQLVRAITSLKPPVPMPEPMPDEPPVPISPLGELREKIAARSIGVETQTYLVHELKQFLNKPATHAEALGLLQRLQNHPDMRVGVANEITTILTPYVPRKLPETPKNFPSRRLMAGGLVGLVAIMAVVIGLVLLPSGGDDGDKGSPTGEQTQTRIAANLTDTPTYTPSATNEASATNTTVATPSPTDKPTATSTQTSTATSMPSPTDKPTSTRSPTDEPTATSTPTNTATNMPSPTDTPSSTPSATNAISPTLPPGFEKVTSNAQWQERADWVIEKDFDGVTMVLVPAGCFMMGSENGESDERPVREQCFDEPFWMDKYEVTNEQYGSVGCSQYSSEPDQPRNCISWFEARDYCESRGARLPTEREWEYAARGPDNLVYPWGDTYDAALVIGADDSVYGSNKTAPVGSRLEGISWVGALDMSGNLWEWTNTIYGVYDFNQSDFVSLFAYPYNSEDGRERDSEERTDVRVLRGGSFINSSLDLRAAFRSWGNPNFEYIYFGFRCARSINSDS